MARRPTTTALAMDRAQEVCNKTVLNIMYDSMYTPGGIHSAPAPHPEHQQPRSSYWCCCSERPACIRHKRCIAVMMPYTQILCTIYSMRHHQVHAACSAYAPCRAASDCAAHSPCPAHGALCHQLHESPFTNIMLAAQKKRAYAVGRHGSGGGRTGSKEGSRIKFNQKEGKAADMIAMTAWLPPRNSNGIVSLRGLWPKIGGESGRLLLLVISPWSPP